MSGTQQSPKENKEPRIIEIIDACWNCENKATHDPMEHETDEIGYYCMMDGCGIELFNKCKDYKKDIYFFERKQKIIIYPF